MHAIRARDLDRRFAPGRGVCGVSLAVGPGECYAVLGPNGSGKSTLVRLILGLARPAGGTLEVLGEAVWRGSRAHLARCAAALERPVHWDRLSGRANAAFAARAYGLGGPALGERLDALLAEAGLADQADEPVETYSFGMRRKLALVRALAPGPKLLVLDEPTAGVDAHYALRLAERVRGRAAEGRATFVASNDPEWVEAVADRVAFMDAGRIVAEDAPAALAASVEGLEEVRLTLAGPFPVPPPEAMEGLESFVQEGETVTALGTRGPSLAARVTAHAAAAGADVRALEVRRPTLRDAFLARTGRAVAP